MTARFKNFLFTLLLLTTVIFMFTACAGGEDASTDSQGAQDLVISSGDAKSDNEDDGEEAEDSEDASEPEESDWEGEEAGDLMDLTGTWTSDPTDGSWVEAVIDDATDTITIRCLSDDGDTSTTYWVGTYDPPGDEESTYQWKSEREEAPDADMSSSDDAMEISYSDDALHFEMTQNGEKKSVELICG